MARTIMSIINFSQKQQETSNVMTALQLMEAPAIAPIAVQDFFDLCIQATPDGVESIYNIEVQALSTATPSAPPVNQHATYIFEESVYSLDLTFESSPVTRQTNANIPEYVSTEVHTRVDVAP